MHSQMLRNQGYTINYNRNKFTIKKEPRAKKVSIPNHLSSATTSEIDLEEREKDFLLKAEMPGFKKENIEIEVEDDFVAITGEVGWKYDKKEHEYLCKERACKTFYRIVDLPEEIKVDEVTANLTEGVLEITLPKKMPKQKRKVKVE